MTPSRKPLPLLTRAESELMRLLWRGPSTVSGLLEQVNRPVVYTTVLNTLRTLEEKGYVRHRTPAQGGRAFVYEAAVPEERVKRRHVGDLVDRLFGGRADDLISGLLENESLSTEELERLRSRIEERLGAHSRRKQR